MILYCQFYIIFAQRLSLKFAIKLTMPYVINNKTLQQDNRASGFHYKSGEMVKRDQLCLKWRIYLIILRNYYYTSRVRF